MLQPETPDLPEIQLYATKSIAIETAGALAVSRLVCFSPAPDFQGIPGILLRAASNNNITVTPIMKYPEDKGLIVELFGEGEHAEEQLDGTIRDMEILANPMRKPEDTIGALYPLGR